LANQYSLSGGAMVFKDEMTRYMQMVVLLANRVYPPLLNAGVLGLICLIPYSFTEAASGTDQNAFEGSASTVKQNGDGAGLGPHSGH
jgi:hypothetical protein